VTNQHDPVDAWLERDVTPLNPPAGSLERIRYRARRRKRSQALLAAAGCAVVVAGAAIVPQFAGQGPAGQAGQAGPPANGKVMQPGSPSTGTPASTRAPESTHATRIPQTTQPSTLSSSKTIPPPGFRPTSVTFVGTGTGGVIGAVIGQAGTAQHPCFNRGDCTSLAGTSNYGKSWFGVAAPVTPGTTSASGVSQLRFLNTRDGWAFGPGLWATTGGGWPWAPENTYGLRVTDLEAASGRAFAIFASCSGPTTSYASGCTSFSLYSSAGGASTWTPVAVPAAFRTMKTAVASSASLVISGGTTGYLLTPSGQVLSGPVSGGAWTLAGKAPCDPGPAQASGIPADAQLTAGQSLMLACDTQAGSGDQTTIYTSPTGATWTRAAVVATSGAATSLAANSTGQAVLATTSGLYYSADNGTTWRQASVTGSPAGGFSYVGLTNSTQAVAIPADSGAGEIFVTSDGGQTWTASPITGQ
jgi:hypothetical protein